MPINRPDADQTLRRAVAAELKAARNGAGLSQLEVEARTGISKRRIIEIEQAKKAISTREMSLIAEASSMSMPMLLSRINERMGIQQATSTD